MITRLLLTLTALMVLVTPAVAQDMPPLFYDFTWTVDSSYSPLGGGPRTEAHLTGSGLLTYTTSPAERRVTMSFGTPSNGGNFSFFTVSTAAGLHADDTFAFATGLEVLNPPIPGGCGMFPGGRNCRVAEFTTPSNAFDTPTSFTLFAGYGFDCLGPGASCNGAAGWESMLHGTAALHTTTATAAEPATLITVAAGLLAARAFRRRRR